MFHKYNYMNTTTMFVTSLEIMILGVVFMLIPGMYEHGLVSIGFASLFDREVFGIFMLSLGIWGILLSHEDSTAQTKYFWLRPKNICLTLMSMSVCMVFFIAVFDLVNRRLVNNFYLYFLIVSIVLYFGILVRIWVGISAVINQEFEYSEEYTHFKEEIQSNLEKRKASVLQETQK